jgi:hypothetical protein
MKTFSAFMLEDRENNTRKTQVSTTGGKWRSRKNYKKGLTLTLESHIISS